MPDEPSPYKPLDPGRIDTLDEVEMRYWSQELHCTVAELQDAVAKVGAHVSAVRALLASRG